MPVPSAAVGLSTDPVVHDVDERWTMAYAGGIGDLSPRYLDTTAARGVVAHPLFAVCLEWPVVRSARRLIPEEILPADEAARGVHATHHVQIQRLVRPGDRLRTIATVVGVQRRSPGAYQTLRLTTSNADGTLVCVTHMGSLFLGVEVEGDDRPAPPLASENVVRDAQLRQVEPVAHRSSRTIAANAALVYTECARIWNPIHTDPAVARAAGLPAPILHGTATLAMAVTGIVDRFAGGRPEAVQTIACRFGAMVLMPSSIDIVTHADDATGPVAFEVLSDAGERAMRDGVVTLRSDGAAEPEQEMGVS